MKYSIIFIISLFFLHIEAQAQYDIGAEVASNAQKSVSLPSTPDVAPFEKYGNIPVSKYNGLTGISIPIYSINLDGKQIPIEIAYQGGGVQVEQEASRVGLGWMLNAGGVIIQQIVDKDDFAKLNVNGATISHEIMPLPTEGSYAGDYLEEYEYGYDINILNNYDIADDEIFGYSKWFQYKETIDIGRDIFSINMAGLSGKFIIPVDNDINIRSNTSVKMLNNLRYKISFMWDTYGNINGIQVIDDAGYKYKFEIFDELYSQYYIMNRSTFEAGSNFSSRTFYITEIESPLGNSVYYDYHRIAASAFSFSLSESLSITQGGLDDGTDPQVIQNPRFIIGKEINELERIRFQNGSVLFTNSSIPRKDLPNSGGLSSYPLESITVYNSLSHYFGPVNPTATIKHYKFITSYFESIEDFYYNSGIIFNPYPKTADYFKYRLKLDAIVEVINGVSTPPFRFEYINKNILPNRLNMGRDLWGYYNGINLTKSLIPIEAKEDDEFGSLPIDIKEEINNNFGNAFSNHPVNETTNQYGTLNKITYPTGGYTVITYSTNRYFEHEGDMIEKLGGGLRVETITDYDADGTQYNKKSYSYIGGLLHEPLFFKRQVSRYQINSLGTASSYSQIFSFFSESTLGQNKLAMGSSIGYDRVIETINNEDNGHIEYDYEQYPFGDFDPNLGREQIGIISPSRLPGIPNPIDRRNGSLK